VLASTGVDAMATVDSSAMRANEVAASVVIVLVGVVSTELTASRHELSKWFRRDVKQGRNRRCGGVLLRPR
jgi:hypothetical protein